MQGCDAPVVSFIDIGAVGDEEFGNLSKATQGRDVQRCPAEAIPGIDLGTLGDQQFHNDFVTGENSPLQRRVSVFVRNVYVRIF